MDPRLDFFLSRVSRRFQDLRLGWLLTLSWFLALLALVMAFAWKPAIFAAPYRVSLWLAVSGLLCGASAWLCSRMAFRDRRWLATQIERCHPGLNQRLITAVTPREEADSKYLRKEVTEETLLHAYTHDWNLVVPKRSMGLAWFAQFVFLFGVIGMLIAANTLGSVKESRILELFSPFKSTSMEVQPGNTEIERGTNCLVTVRFQGPLPDQVALHAREVDSEEAMPSTTEMQRSLNDPVFASYLAKVTRDTEYQIEIESGRSEKYRVNVFDFPALARSDAELSPPEYSQQEPRIVKDTRRVTVPEGTHVQWICHVNKPLESVKLIDENGEVIAMTLSSESTEGLLYQASIVAESNRKWKVNLKDDAGRSSKIQETISITVLPNKPPELKAEKITDATVSPLEELSIQANVRDDFSLVRAGVQYSLAGGELEDRVLWESSKQLQDATPAIDADKKPKTTTRVSKGQSVHYLLDFEAMESTPDQLLSYYFWAEDLDRDGKIRRVDGEMYFAEVRPFDEIFRQGDPSAGEPPPSGPPSPQAQKAEELAELQKKIISGTWNTIRTQTTSKLTEKGAEDVGVLVESQDEAIGMAVALEEKLQDEKSRQHLDSVLDAMEQTIEQLEASVSEQKSATLRTAMKHEQAAYEGLLKLRAREHEITKSKKSKSKSSSASQKNRQKQLEQMELKEDEERYEKEQQASTEEEAADREMRQVMSRLDELARRQEDINRQLKDLETAIQSAKTEEVKKELEEQLKRLRENQEELLRDTDELMDRMQTAEKSTKQEEAMQQAQEQLAQAREDIRKAAEALASSQPSAAQALSSGSRAETQIEETRDQLREQSAQRFEETMKDMLSEARKLEKDQSELSAKTLDGSAKLEASSSQQNTDEGGLRPGAKGESTEEPSREQAWGELQKRTSELLERMQDTVTEAEPSEPLLAEKLYDTFRKTKQRDVENQFNLIPRLVERGLAAPVQQTLDEIETGVRELREGVESAAESVLGSEVDGLRRALKEIEDLERQLNQEIASRGGRPGETESPERGEPSSPSDSTAPSDPSAAPANSQQPESDSKSGKGGKGEKSGKGKAAEGEKSGKSQGKSEKSDSQSKEKNGSKSGDQPGNQPGDPNSRGGNSGSLSLNDVMEQNGNPITGNNFGEWSDALRDVEESVRDPEMRGVASGIRQAARELRRDYQRHSKEPQWDLVRELVSKPLSQLRESVQAELLRKSADRNAVVPIDRDPVPSIFEQRLRQYYENLGSQKATVAP
ncbi:MAG: hypothetical protein SGI77_14320 [Pirellulaceae bacterium]|nr:hypothetical protein [Pirellulaceae bacterium]